MKTPNETYSASDSVVMYDLILTHLNYSILHNYYSIFTTLSLEGHVGAQGSIQQGGGAYTGNIQPAGGWWTAFGTGGFEGEPPLLEGASSRSYSE